MKRRIFIALLLVVNSAFAHQVVLRSGEVVKVKHIQFQKQVLICDGREIPRDSVLRIVFEGEEGKKEKVTVSSDVAEILEKARKAREVFKNAQGIVLLDDGVYTLKKDSTRVYRYHFQGLILSNETMDWAKFSLYFDDVYEKPNIIMARTIKPDGRVYEVKKEDIKVTKPRSEFVYFQRGKIMTFEFPQVSPGDIVEYVYEVEIFNPWNKAVFTPGWFFGGEQPVYFSHYKIIVPEGVKLNYKLLNAPMVKVEKKVEGDKVIYEFSAHNVKPYIKEVLMPPVADILPRLVASNLSSWDYLFDWYGNFQKRRMEITPRIKALADSLVKDAKTEDDTIAKIYYWVQQKIRYISIKGAASSGVSGHPAEVTLENGFGDCTDKSILFSTLLRAVGVEAYPVYVNTNDAGTLVKEIPTFYGNHCITEIIKKDGTKMFLDATGYYSRYPSFWSADHGVYAINALKRSIEFIPVPPPERNMRNYEYEITIDTSGSIYVKFHSTYSGYYETGLRYFWNSKRKEEWDVIMRGMVSRVHPDAKLVSYELKNLTDLEKPFEMFIEYKIDGYVEHAGKMWVFKLPELEERYTFSEVSSQKRIYDLVYQTSAGIRHTVKITYPENFKIAFIPDSVYFETSHASYKAQYSVEDGKIIFSDIFKRWHRKIPVSDYLEYKNLIQKLQSFIRKPVLFEGGEK